MTALVVDDEPLARALLKHLLEPLGVQVVGEASEAEEAILLAEELTPDLVFLDIRMPGINGVDATKKFGEFDPAPLVILVTGFSDHAIEAFENSAFDYLLKPVSSERLELAVNKARRQLTLRRRANRGALVPTVRRLPIRVKGSYRIVPMDTILYANSSEKSVIVKTTTGEYRTNYTLSYLEEVLPQNFMRIHASCIVNLGAIEELLVLGNHSYAITVVTGIELPVGRLQYSKLQERLGFPVEP